MSWPDALPGLVHTDAGDVHFTDPREEARQALDQTVAAPLAHLGTLSVTGADAVAFLQGQLSNDVNGLGDQKAQLTSFNSPKGRMLAVFHAYRRGDALFLETRRSIIEATLKRLRMYVLRAKAVLEDASERVAVIGIAGPNAGSLLADSGWPVPDAVMACAWRDQACIIRRHDAGGRLRYTLHLPPDSAATAFEQLLQRKARAVGSAAWQLLDIEAGVPSIHPQTADRFVAQMCNLDQLGGISFNKGCYTGQEVIARVYYRGAVKRHLVTLDHPDTGLEPGTKLDDPPGAEVVDAAPAPHGGSRVLAVARE